MGSVHMTSDLCTYKTQLPRPILDIQKTPTNCLDHEVAFCVFYPDIRRALCWIECWNCDENCDDTKNHVEELCDENVHFCHRLKDDDGLSLSCAYDPPLTKQCSVVEDRF